MPIYEYRCDGCGHEMELMQRMSDDPMKDCPVCQESKLKKLISAAGFRLKGSGWYETDFKKGKKSSVQVSPVVPEVAVAALVVNQF
ncbi:MAG: zinc ribbon domain-containing protein [gamma proteobacterium symbiont of Bathyaustriella thionipta]|nr:zinc ribbon domain-containing protein [gamma proteobacterium symbiont of Bathyaustriella thionipta]MCU7949692.1 zinc ribbon domain-containing protein [gamma proteobacterium symbiont of Bathyaustriella thionipta]MCU7953110.1 zinc ribbon domain-containing protein [gamma proteobacterium symbiont of Bathyaustriella thionipta]MCU7956300.1 zinc ribbon domain-containing protein [gamma proteobacterium symbiont of Bathyaustriella thionipta]MCU7967662.1 zinc ribbon domain-containing protein [gamma pro